jgi:hypothetical protein
MQNSTCRYNNNNKIVINNIKFLGSKKNTTEKRKGEAYTAAAMPEANTERREQDGDEDFAADLTTTWHFLTLQRLMIQLHD